MTPDELPALLKEIRDRAATAAPPVVMAMAETYQRRVQSDLRRLSHPAYSKTPSAPGSPPARISGELARSVTAVRGVSSGTYATATVAPHTVYARVQEVGAVITARRRRFLRFLTDYPTPVTSYAKSLREGGGLFLNFARTVHIPPRPYMRPATRECIEDGSLTRAAMAAFMERVWG